MKRLSTRVCKHNRNYVQTIRTSASKAAAHIDDVTSIDSVTSQSADTGVSGGCPFGYGSQTTKSSTEETSSLEHARDFEEIPGPPRLPLIGNALAYSKFGETPFCAIYIFIKGGGHWENIFGFNHVLNVSVISLHKFYVKNTST